MTALWVLKAGDTDNAQYIYVNGSYKSNLTYYK